MNALKRIYPHHRQILAEMGEWMALGFYEGVDMPWPRAFGLAFRRLYENMPIRLRKGALLLPCEPFPVKSKFSRQQGDASWYWTNNEQHHATGLLCDFMHHCGIHVNREMIAERKQAFPQYAAFIEDLVADSEAHLPHFGGYTHANPDIRCVVSEGFDAMERELDEEIARAAGAANADAAEANLLAALKDYAIGVRAFHCRAAAAIQQAANEESDAVRQVELRRIAENFATCFLRPSANFLQGLLAVHFTWLLDGCDSIGRVDQALGYLYEADIACGALSVEFARRLLDEFFQQFERYNGWNLQLGGYRPDGQDGANALTREMLYACGRNRQRRPNVALRITERTPAEVLTLALEVLRDGSGRPALYNDDLYVATLQNMDLGLSAEDAREIGFGGCTETMIAGMSNVGSLEGEINLAHALHLALHDGYNPLTRAQEGPHTGKFEDFPDFAAFRAAVQRQIDWATDGFVAANRHALAQRFSCGDPKLYRTFFTRDCVRRRCSFEAGGARYNWAIVSYQGIANLIDSLAAIEKLVYEERRIGPGELLRALDANFVGHENLRRMLQAAPKFGNDIAEVDELGVEMVSYAWRRLYAHATPRGGRYLPSCILFTTYGIAGAKVGALPDGRLAGTPLVDSVGPSPGCDTRGPTAMLKSVARLPLWLAAGTPVLNIRLQRHLMETPAGLQAVNDLLRGFFALGGMQIQITVISKEEMLAAQKEPEKYRDLIVRIGGYSEYFIKLDRALQESVIARTAHGA